MATPADSEIWNDETISNLVAALSPAEDLNKWTTLEEQLQDIDRARSSSIQGINAQVQTLSSTLSALKESSSRIRSRSWKSEAAHASTMEELQREKFGLAKEISDGDEALMRVEADLARLREELEGVDAYDVEENSAMDKEAIAATFFRKLGFVPCYGKDDSIDTLMVRSDAKNRTVMFNIGEAEMATQGVSRYMNAQLMWQASE